jgi:phosphatidate phosphatase APP1
MNLLREKLRRWWACDAFTAFATGLMTLFCSGVAKAQETNLKPDERIVFYPSGAQRVPGETNLWRAEIRGRIFEPEQRSALVITFRQAIELKADDLTATETALFNERARLFLVDHERGKKIYVRLGTNEIYVGESAADGRFGAEVFLRAAELEQPISFRAALRAGDARVFAGEIFPLEEVGVSVISDIDDTIKITQVRDKAATLRNTFLREFQPAAGMAEFYQTLAGNPRTRPSANSNRPVAADVSPLQPPPEEVRADSRRLLQNESVTFHYISASPWQLYEPLAAFVASNGFPAGAFELKEFRWKNRTFFSLFADPVEYKMGLIEPLLKQFPRRQFIMIGDSGERDPEIYGALARKYPQQVIRIFIRDVTEELATAERYQKAFLGIPRGQWQIFREPTNLKPPMDAAGMK